MGAEQSSPNSRVKSAPRQKTCYYQLLGLSSPATDEEIRRAYKRKALELHPDRNINDVDAATKRFSEVQTAYEVLSDPHERAWYDSHRDAILRGDDQAVDNADDPGTQYNIRITTADCLFGLIGKFDSSIPMNDATDGFYGILRTTFLHLAKEEEAACNAYGLDYVDYPGFGSSTDGYSTVVRPFYNIWTSFSTRKTYSWKDKYRLSEAPDRRVRRLMEKENKKLRSDGSREFNDAVRSLVLFARKRDKRFISGAGGPRSEDSMRKAAAAQAARARAANRESMASQNFAIPEWVRSPIKGEHDGEFPESDQESAVEEIECVICDKIFKTEKAFESHEKSKKHVKAMRALKLHMRKDDTDLDLAETEQERGPGNLPRSENRAEGPPADSTASCLPESGGQEYGGQTKQENQDGDDQEALVSTEEDLDSDYAPQQDTNCDSRLKLAKPTPTLSSENKPNLMPDLSMPKTKSQSKQDQMSDLSKKVGRAKQKRQKKAAARESDSMEGKDSENRCAVCTDEFPSRTKLFKHMRQLNHFELTELHSVPKGKKSSKGK